MLQSLLTALANANSNTGVERFNARVVFSIINVVEECTRLQKWGISYRAELSFANL